MLDSWVTINVSPYQLRNLEELNFPIPFPLCDNNKGESFNVCM